MKFSVQSLRRISFLAYDYEVEDEFLGDVGSAKVEFVNGLVLFISKSESICPRN